VLNQLTENALKFTRSRNLVIIKIWAEAHGEAWTVCVQGTPDWALIQGTAL
jgi:hypothetical protein